MYQGGGYSAVADNYLSDIPLSIRGRIEAFLKSASFLRQSPVVTHLSTTCNPHF
jgi:hypothetical protein